MESDAEDLPLAPAGPCAREEEREARGGGGWVTVARTTGPAMSRAISVATSGAGTYSPASTVRISSALSSISERRTRPASGGAGVSARASVHRKSDTIKTAMARTRAKPPCEPELRLWRVGVIWILPETRRPPRLCEGAAGGGRPPCPKSRWTANADAAGRECGDQGKKWGDCGAAERFRQPCKNAVRFWRYCMAELLAGPASPTRVMSSHARSGTLS